MRSNWLSESGAVFIPPEHYDHIRLHCENPKCDLYFLTPYDEADATKCLFCSHVDASPIFYQALPETYLYHYPTTWFISTG